MKRLRLVALAATFAGLLLLAGPASAHVTVTAPGATRGGSDQEITFRVPVEKDVNTVKLQVQLPTATPIASVLVNPVPGWTHTQQSTKLTTPIKTDDGNITTAVSEITWTATDGGLKPGEFGAFTIIAGQLPSTDRLVFKAIQTYSDGSKVSWIQVPAAGTAEPDNPAPVLDLTAASKTAAPAHPAAAASAKSSSSSNTGPIVLAIIALVLAAGTLGFVVVTRAKASS